jgi:hypothetical protein
MLTKVYTALAAVVLAHGVAVAIPRADAESAAGRSRGREQANGLDSRLAASVNLAWQGRPLDEALASLAHAQGISILRDRRVDPDQRIDLTISNSTLQSALDTLAANLNLGVSNLGIVIYLGPRDTATRLRTVAWRTARLVDELPDGAAKLWRREKRLSWNEASTPRDIVRDLCREAGTRIENLNDVPHDLWAEVSLPPTPLADRLALVLIQFDRMWEFTEDHRMIRIVPIPDTIEAEMRVPLGRNQAETLAQWRTRLPRATVTAEAGQVVLRGLIEDLQGFDTIARRGNPRIERPQESRYQLTVRVEDQPLEPLVGQICQRLGLTLEWDRTGINSAGLTSDVKVSCDVKNGSLEELMRAILEPVGLDYRREDKALTIIPFVSGK